MIQIVHKLVLGSGFGLEKKGRVYEIREDTCN